jgi:hypothetical protein
LDDPDHGGRIGPPLHHVREGRIDLVVGAGGKNFDLPPMVATAAFAFAVCNARRDVL